MALSSGLRWLWLTALRGLPMRRPSRAVSTVRWFSALGMTTLLAGAFVSMATFAFARGVGTTIGFAVSIVVCCAGVAMAFLGWWRRRLKFELGGAAITVVAVWTIVAASGTFADATARWIAFGSGIGYMALGLAVLVVYEASVERVVHLLEVRELPRGSRA